MSKRRADGECAGGGPDQHPCRGDHPAARLRLGRPAGWCSPRRTGELGTGTQADGSGGGGWLGRSRPWRSHAAGWGGAPRGRCGTGSRRSAGARSRPPLLTTARCARPPPSPSSAPTSTTPMPVPLALARLPHLTFFPFVWAHHRWVLFGRAQPANTFAAAHCRPLPVPPSVCALLPALSPIQSSPRDDDVCRGGGCRPAPVSVRMHHLGRLSTLDECGRRQVCALAMRSPLGTPP